MPQRQEGTRKHKVMHKKISAEKERIGKNEANATYAVRKELGPGLLEKVFEVCFCHIFINNGFRVDRQSDIPVVFDGNQQ